MTASALALRMSLFYAVSFLISGIYGPYFAVWLKGEGLAPGYVGLILALPMFARMVAGPLLAFLADRTAKHRLVVQALTVAALAGFLAPGVIGCPAGLIIIVCTNAIVLPSIVPVAETFAIDGVQRFGLDYGRMRMWGSMMFVVANVVGGAILARFGSEAILSMLIVAALATLAVTLLLPGSLAAGYTARLQFNEIGGLLRQPRFARLLAATGAIQCSAGFFNTFATLAWQSRGISAGVIGLLSTGGGAGEAGPTGDATASAVFRRDDGRGRFRGDVTGTTEDAVSDAGSAADDEAFVGLESTMDTDLICTSADEELSAGATRDAEAADGGTLVTEAEATVRMACLRDARTADTAVSTRSKPAAATHISLC